MLDLLVKLLLVLLFVTTGRVPSGTPDATSAPGNASTPNELGHEFVMKEIPTSCANKLSPTIVDYKQILIISSFISSISLISKHQSTFLLHAYLPVTANITSSLSPLRYATLLPISAIRKKKQEKKETPLKANLQKLAANVLNDADYDVWLPLASVHEGVDSMLRNGPWMFCGILIFLNKFSPSVSLPNKGLSRVPVWVKFHESSYARILIEINACNDFSYNLVMVVPNLEGTGYMKETVRVEYEMDKGNGGSSGADDEGFIEVKKNLVAFSCPHLMIFGYSLDDCPKAPKQVVNRMYNSKGGSYGADDEGFIEVKRRNLVVIMDAAKTLNCNSFDALNVENPVIEDTEMGDTNSMFGVSKDEDESVENEMASYLASKPLGVRYGTKSLLEQWKETYVNADYDLYDDDMYEGH
ncbi:hypothetical protein Tco_0296232 [Tanacetum coccineum]